jgi:DinB family protein
MTAAIQTIDGSPLSPEAIRMLDYLRTRTAELDAAAICERVRAATNELEKVVDSVPEADIRVRPMPGKWNIAEVVDHIAQTQIRSAEELRHLFAGRRPPGPPVYEALRTGAAAWAPWAELVDGLRSANQELIALLESSPNTEPANPPKVLTILVVTRALPDGTTGPQIFPIDLGWKEYALLQRLHLLDHRTQVRKLREALAAR